MAAWARPGRGGRGGGGGSGLGTGALEPPPPSPWSGSAKQLRRDFRRLGPFRDREIVALVGFVRGTAGGDPSSAEPWARAPVPKFSNLYFEELESYQRLSKWWIPAFLRRLRREAAAAAPPAAEQPGGSGLAALPADAALASDWRLRRHARRFARDEEAFARELAGALARLLDSGVARPPPEARWWRSPRRAPPAPP